MMQQPGSITEKEASIHISNLMLIDPKSEQPTKVGRRVENGKIVRYAKKTGQTI
jgi:large subunit ribosomal protein L24